MIIDLDETPLKELPEYDICIVGSGPAGMTAARELMDSGLEVCVLESGKRKPTRQGDRLRRVISEGIRIKEYSRERVLGGASSTWSGLSGLLDSIDMEPRPFLNLEGWPISREELFPYYREAAERYRFPPLELFEPGGLDAVKAKGDFTLEWDKVEEKVFLAAAEPQHFGREFGSLFDRPKMDLYLAATVICLEGSAACRRAERAVLRAGDGRDLTVGAKIFVLSTGGIENARILLNSRDWCPQGLGNEHDQVGRCLMNHPKNYYGHIKLNRPVKELPYYLGCLFQGYAGYAGLRLTEEMQRRLGVLNSYVRFEPLYPWSDNRGVEAFVLIAKRCKLLLRSFRRMKGGKVVSLRDYSETGDDSPLQNERKSLFDWIRLFFFVLVNLPQVLRYLYYRLFEKAEVRLRRIRLRNFMEMEPNPENRVILGEEKDPYGQPVPVVRHQCTELDRRSLEALHEILGEEVRRNGLGELSSDLAHEKTWPIDLDASHHMGTTRMGDDPSRSVTDRNAKIHGAENVYAAGASLFPTSGCANPTMTLVALSIRLARHLKEQVLKNLP